MFPLFSEGVAVTGFTGSGTSEFAGFGSDGTGSIPVPMVSGLLFPMLAQATPVILEFTGSGDSEFPAFESSGTGTGPAAIRLLPFGGFGRPYYRAVFTGRGSSELPRFGSGGQGELVFAGYGTSNTTFESAGEGFMAQPPHEDYELLTALLAAV